MKIKEKVKCDQGFLFIREAILRTHLFLFYKCPPIDRSLLLYYEKESSRKLSWIVEAFLFVIIRWLMKRKLMPHDHFLDFTSSFWHLSEASSIIKEKKKEKGGLKMSEFGRCEHEVPEILSYKKRMSGHRKMRLKALPLASYRKERSGPRAFLRLTDFPFSFLFLSEIAISKWKKKGKDGKSCGQGMHLLDIIFYSFFLSYSHSSTVCLSFYLSLLAHRWMRRKKMNENMCQEMSSRSNDFNSFSLLWSIIIDQKKKKKSDLDDRLLIFSFFFFLIICKIIKMEKEYERKFY